MIKKKRYIWFLLVLMTVVGCKNKELSCTKMVINKEEVKVEEKLDFTFKKNSLLDSTFSLNYSFSNNVERNSDAMKKSLEEQFSIYKDSKGVNYSFSDFDQGFRFELHANVSKLSEEEKSNLESMVQYENINDAKEKLIKEGYQCN